ncbi:Uncharacterised protein [Mycobacterium tuberculosis]|nr:Uncharacterised protein [Mycobacterium tuberculosis]
MSASFAGARIFTRSTSWVEPMEFATVRPYALVPGPPELE